MGSPVQSLIADPQFQSLSSDGQRAAVRGVGGDDFTKLSDSGLDTFILQMHTMAQARAVTARVPTAGFNALGQPAASGPGESSGAYAPTMSEIDARNAAATPALPAPPPTPTTFFGRAWDEAKNIASSFGPQGPSVGPIPNPPPATLGLAQTAVERGKEFKEHPAAAAGATATDVAAAVLPFALHAGYGALDEHVLEPRRITKGTELGKKGLGIPSPPEAAEVAGRTAPEGVNLARDFDLAKADLAKVSRETPITAKGSAASFQWARSVLDYSRNLWETEHAAPIARNVNQAIDHSAIVQKAMAELTPEAMDADPAGARRAMKWIQQSVNKARSLGSADAFVRELNADVDTPRAKQTYGPLDMRVRQATLRGLRSEIDTTLTNLGETGVHDVNQRYGALTNLADQAIQQGLAEAKSEGKQGILPDWVHTYAFAHHGGMSAGAGMNLARLATPTPSGQLTKGMGKLGRTSLEPPSASPGPFIPTPPGNVPLGPPRPPNYQPPSTQATPVGAPPPTAGFPPTAPVARGPQWEPTPRSSQPASNLWNLSPDVARPGGQGGLPPTVAPASGMVAAEFKRLGLSDLVTPRQSTTLETMMRGPRWRDFDRNERLDAVRAVLHPAEDVESMVRRRPTGRLPEPPAQQGEEQAREERFRQYRRITKQPKKGE